METGSAIGVVLSDDLMFSSRITGTARSLGLSIKPARTIEILENHVRQASPRCVILDLAFPTLQLADLLDWLRKSGAPMPRVVAYGSHVDAARLEAARHAGWAPVLPRRAVVEHLPGQLRAW